jgi:phosphatidylglycerophosphatase A
LPIWHPTLVLGTWFGVGSLPAMPGTWASLAALACAWAIHGRWGGIGLAAATAIIFAAGCWAVAKVARASGADDPHAIVIDEVAGQWLALTVVPRDLLSYFLVFVLFRVFDIWKPWPVRWADRHVGGGLGIMLDDLLAGAYVALVSLVLINIYGVFGVRR